MQKMRVDFYSRARILFLRSNHSGTVERSTGRRNTMRTALAAFLFVFAFAFAAQAAGPTDNDLTRRVKSALSATIGVPARDIEIIVLDRVVALHGRVPSQSVREAAA